MTVSSGAQCGVFGSAGGVVLDGDASPMEDGIGEASVTSISSDDEAAFAGSLSDGSDACQASQGVIVSPLQGISGICQQRGEDSRSDSWRGGEDVDVTLLWLPRLGLLVVAELCGEAIECLVSIADLAVDQANAVDQGGDVSAGGLGRAVGDGDRLLAQDVEGLCGVEAADAVALEGSSWVRVGDPRAS